MYGGSQQLCDLGGIDPWSRGKTRQQERDKEQPADVFFRATPRSPFSFPFPLLVFPIENDVIDECGLISSNDLTVHVYSFSHCSTYSYIVYVSVYSIRPTAECEMRSRWPCAGKSTSQELRHRLRGPPKRPGRPLFLLPSLFQPLLSDRAREGRKREWRREYGLKNS